MNFSETLQYIEKLFVGDVTESEWSSFECKIDTLFSNEENSLMEGVDV